MIAPASLKHARILAERGLAESPLRGMIAPASLKLLQDVPLPRWLTPTPGHDCPGLIEALFGFLQILGVPGSTPGHDCPGLIEARGDDKVRAQRTRRTTPGHDCPGLIEAGLPRLPRGSPSSTPGHDCPGLIEALDPYP